MQQVVDCPLSKDKNVTLISYADGDAVHFANQNTLSSSAINKCVDNIILYNKKHIDDNFKNKNYKILDSKRGAGYWLWKPYIIMDSLNKIQESVLLIII